MKQSESFTNSSCTGQISLAERELSAFIAAVAELYGAEEARASAEDWFDESESMDFSPRSTHRDWRTITIAASVRLANRLNVALCRQTAFGTSKSGTELLPIPLSNCSHYTADLTIFEEVHENSIRRTEVLMSKIWLVTGSASGLGREIAEAVLTSGDRLLATARDPQRLNDLVERYGKQVSIAPLDVADEAAAKAAVAKAVDVFGRLDVLVNNAGYGDTAPFEQVSSERFRALIETNFFGVVSTTRAAIPIMRTQKSGCILQISSVGGRLATPGNAAYHAAKWAIGGFTEAIAQEVAAFGVKVCALEPGGMRTNWGNRAHADVPILLPEYEPSVGALVKSLETYWGHETSAPAKVAQVILQLVTKEQLPAHLLLGSDAVQYARLAAVKRKSDAEAWLDVSVSTDAEGVQEHATLNF